MSGRESGRECLCVLLLVVLVFDNIHGEEVERPVEPAVGVDGDDLALVLADVDGSLDRFQILQEVLDSHVLF